MKRSIPLVLLVLFLLIVMAGCSLGAPPLPTATPTVACAEDGRIERTRVESSKLGWPISVEVYLPPCYDQQAEAAYPVLYLIPVLNSAASTWNLAGAAEVANRMIRAGEIPAFILVTPGNYPSDSHGEALMDDLFPYIEETYRTLNDRTHRAVGGASMGGAIAYRMALRRPERFNSVGIFGSGVVSGDEGNVEEWIAAIPPEQWPRILLDCGDEDTLMLDHVDRTMAILDEWEIPYRLNVEPGGHSYTYWGSNLEMYYAWYAEVW